MKIRANFVLISCLVCLSSCFYQVHKKEKRFIGKYCFNKITEVSIPEKMDSIVNANNKKLSNLKLTIEPNHDFYFNEKLDFMIGVNGTWRIGPLTTTTHNYLDYNLEGVIKKEQIYQFIKEPSCISWKPKRYRGSGHFITEIELCRCK